MEPSDLPFMPKRRLRLALLLLLGLALAVFLLAPSPVDPLAYEPPAPPPLAGPLAPNRELAAAELLGVGRVTGPEDVAVDREGRIYGGTADGRIVRLTLTADGGETIETFADTGGRPLGLAFDPAGNLLVADAVRGLLSVAPDGRVTTLATEADGVPFRFTDDLDVAADGTVYFSDASSRFGHLQYKHDLLEARPHGRLLAYDPATGRTRVLLGDLYFANGVALSSDEDFVLVNETYRYRITRYWLKGPRAGTSEVFIENLPGFPDGVSGNRRGTFWLALFTVRNPAADRLHPHPWLKAQLAKLPEALWPEARPYGLVLALDETGRVTASLHDPEGERVREITSAEEAGGFLYLGTLHGQWLGRYRLP